MPYLDAAKKREHNRKALATPEGRANNAARQRKHRHKKGNENYRMRQAATYWKFKLRNGTELPALIATCSSDCVAAAEKRVREEMGATVEMEVRKVLV